MAQQILAQRPTTAATDINNELLLSLGISSRIDKHVKKFRWFGTHHWLGEGYDRAKCIQDIAAIVQKGITSREKKVGGAKQSNDSFWQLLATVSYWRTHCAEVTSKVVFESRSKLEQCARQWNLDYPGLLNLSAKEIIERLGKDSAVSLPEHYEQRQEAFGCYIDEAGQEKIIVGDELTRLLRKLVPLVNTDVDEFKGVIANKGGIIIGIAKVLISPRDFTKFEAGDILVAPETTPDFVPLMKKAKAIITDRGGITSHAAIVSRELGIPCVIGTKIATQVLKDGDEVEVDANKGVIKVLNSV